MAPHLSFLLAEDDSDDQELFSEILKKVAPGSKLKIVSNGKDAMNYLAATGDKNLPCAIVLDYNMPNANAAQVLEWLSERAWYNGIHKFVWSTSGDHYFMEQCKRFGAQAYFEKPTSQAGLVKVVQQIVKQCS